MQSKDSIARYLINIYGIVQGVGFRPFVYNNAQKLGLRGYICNIGARVLIDVEGDSSRLKCLINTIVKMPPPLAQVEKISIRKMNIEGYERFEIVKSTVENEDLRFVPKDITICNSCKQDILDKNSRWYDYEFTSCTDCGPRYSIIKELPYDRCNTSMGSFEMCPACKEEYSDPGNRRFHAQPVCCPDCGPKLRLVDCLGKEICTDSPVKEAAKLLKKGSILAVKGIGGFHLMCDAENQQAVANLRSRKKRPHQPLAIMAVDLPSVELQCMVSDKEQQLITSGQSPIVLLKKKASCTLTNLIAPDTDRLGMMLPYTPIHMLLLKEGFRYLVATSGNINGMPMEHQNSKALSSLENVADFLLLHDRGICVPIDDSVTKIVEERATLSRIGRGYAPISTNIGVKKQLIALGAEQKSSVCLSKNSYAYISQYLGDIKSPDAYMNYKKVLDNLISLLKIKPQAYVHDLHPYYLSTRYALEQPGEKLAIQHHFAHMAGCIAEHKLNKPVIGVVYDGTGFGEDGKSWGGEILVGTLESFKRAGHLKCCSIQGGDKAAAEPWRSAASYLYALGDYSLESLGIIDHKTYLTVEAALKAGLNCYESSSMGRLFDCVSALLGLCSKITYEGQAAIILECIADKQIEACYEYEINKSKECILIDYKEIIKSILIDIRMGKNVSEISGKFHNTIAAATADAVSEIGKLHGLREVVLSGGCFENLLLLERLINKLVVKGFKVYFNEKLPCNDGGVSFGQLAAADRILRR